ncbi:MAG: GNAT family N-acetyltransferase [Scytolyngbya sp. HA4215-MV1]|jgi:phosphinothricin acetyltransferase|nr:GNAT family N-acetyltransferase [Scytolyngbya sp. HA4215-MV1]
MYLRDAVEADLATIVAIYNAAIPSRIVTADTEPISVASRHAWFHQHHPEQHPLWVVECDGELAGWLGFQPFYGRPAYCMTAEISLYIAPNYQRQGIGRYLLATAIERCPSLGIKTLLGFIFAANQPSLRLFKQLQFQQWGYLPAIAELDKVEQDLVIVGLRIPLVAPTS